MPKTENNDINQSSRKDKYRHSLQPKSNTEVPSIPLRHAKSYNYDKSNLKKAKTKLPPPIPEVDLSEDPEESSIHVNTRNDNVKLSLNYDNERRKISKSSKKSEEISKEISSYDNIGFDTDLNEVVIKTEAPRSENSARSSIRDPSIQSMSVIREQYCCCSRWSPLERTLFALVAVLVFIIFALVLTIVLISTSRSSRTVDSFIKL